MMDPIWMVRRLWCRTAHRGRWRRYPGLDSVGEAVEITACPRCRWYEIRWPGGKTLLPGEEVQVLVPVEVADLMGEEEARAERF
jgi:hypothetical protein